MPITVTVPKVGAQFGPGSLISAQTTYQPEEPGSIQWTWAIRRTADESTALFEEILGGIGNGGTIGLNFMTWSNTTNVVEGQGGGTIPDQTPVHLVVEVEDSGIVVETSETPVIWNPTINLGLQQYFQSKMQSGFTEADREQLQLAVSNSVVDLTDLTVPPDLSAVPVGRLPGVPPFAWGERVGPFSLIGRNVLDLPAQGVRGIWIGMRWFFQVIPPGWGMTPGAIDEFDARPAQLVPITKLGSGEELGQPIFDTNRSGEFVPLDTMGFTGKVAYDIGPGFRVDLFMYRLIGSG